MADRGREGGTVLVTKSASYHINLSLAQHLWKCQGVCTLWIKFWGGGGLVGEPEGAERCLRSVSLTRADATSRAGRHHHRQGPGFDSSRGQEEHAPAVFIYGTLLRGSAIYAYTRYYISLLLFLQAGGAVPLPG